MGFIIVNRSNPEQAVNYRGGDCRYMWGYWESRNNPYVFNTRHDAESFMVGAPYGIPEAGEVVEVSDASTHSPGQPMD